ncbi:hypothetical protein [Halorubrum coriense]|uniref:hypothetical protein n=1 Tax=Halorubrum coriense TaxID=64713 RepID=UPI001EF9D5E9|nr:hypothetical protein [Halorubrum coriense]
MSHHEQRLSLERRLPRVEVGGRPLEERRRVPSATRYSVSTPNTENGAGSSQRSRSTPVVATSSVRAAYSARAAAERSRGVSVQCASSSDRSGASRRSASHTSAWIRAQ